jgi:hypothetical protein
VLLPDICNLKLTTQSAHLCFTTTHQRATDRISSTTQHLTIIVGSPGNHPMIRTKQLKYFRHPCIQRPFVEVSGWPMTCTSQMTTHKAGTLVLPLSISDDAKCRDPVHEYTWPHLVAFPRSSCTTVRRPITRPC